MAKRRRSLYWSIKLLRSIGYFIPFRVLSRFGSVLGWLAFYLVKKYRNIALSNLQLAFPEKSLKEISSLAKQCFIYQGKGLLETLSLYKLNNGKFDEIVRIEGRENVKAAFEKKKGALVMACHFGNWELLGMGLNIAGIPLNIIARKVYIEELEKLLAEIRTSVGTKIITRGEADTPFKMLRALRHNEGVGILIDQNVKSLPGVYVDFFSRKAYTPTALAAIALKTGAPVLPCFIIRDKDDKFTVEILKPVEIIRAGSRDKDIEVNTQNFTGIIEAHIRRDPAQWVWFHERWS